MEIALFLFTIKPFNTEKREARKAEINPSIIPFKYSNSALKIKKIPHTTTKPRITS